MAKEPEVCHARVQNEKNYRRSFPMDRMGIRMKSIPRYHSISFDSLRIFTYSSSDSGHLTRSMNPDFDSFN